MSVRPRSLAALLLTALATSACATTGATYKSGVGDKLIEHPPFYAGAATTPARAAGARIGVLPVHFQAGVTQPATFEPSAKPGSPTAQLLAEMNAYLDSLTMFSGAAPVRLVAGGRTSAVAPTAMGVPPDVRFGCETETDLPDDDCKRTEGALGRGGEWMKLAVGRPSPEWTQWAGQVMAEHDVSHVLVLTLEVGKYLTRQKGMLGRKVVELGTGHEVAFPWLTSLETPVNVLQLTGALMDRNGQAVRIGAEGILARRTRLLVSTIGAQELVTDDDVQALRTQRREDLPGQPLVWREAMRQLVQQLTR